MNHYIFAFFIFVYAPFIFAETLTDSLDHWDSPFNDHLGWELTDNALHQDVSDQGFLGSDLVSKEVYENFILTFEFYYTEGANSGIKYLIQDEHGNIGLEYQIVDDLGNADNQTPKTQTAGLYDILPAQNKDLLGPNELNRGKIIFQDGKVEHWLNGTKVLSYDLSTDAFREAVSDSKFRSFDWFGTYRSGKILLQHHGDLVYFKEIKILGL